MSVSWQRLRSVFDQAIDLEGEALEVFLVQACGENSGLRSAVEELLEADRRATGEAFLRRPVLERPATKQDAVEPVRAPDPVDLGETRLGAYRILRRIGQGGMGVVYLAVRDDDAFHRRVVIKLVRSDLDHHLSDQDLGRRLRTERQILASLDHPAIAKLYDGGATDGGRPFVVMEYVDGVPIDRFCDDQHLTVDERVALFIKVCAAVHYAHQNLVVHRDIKPSNILVTADGEPKLLDFGIAKLMNPELTDRELDSTATWLRLLTPQYASPEQVRGTLVTTSSDIYSLGVLLYKLLTGVLPFRFAERSPQEIERILTEHEPPRPSRVVGGESRNAPSCSGAAEPTPKAKVDATGAGAVSTRHSRAGASESTAAEIARRRQVQPRQLGRMLAGDLDTIVLKALRSAPHHRYASVERLAADLEKWRQGLPVEARQGSIFYRSGRLMRRHRWACGAAAALGLLLTAFLWMTLLHAQQVERERDQAQLERERKDTVLGVLLDTLGVADPYVGNGEKLTIREALEVSRGPMQRRLSHRPELLAELLQTTGLIYRNLGLWETAQLDLETALDLRVGLWGDDHPDVAMTRSALGVVYAEQGEEEAALEATTWALEVARAQASPGALLRALNAHVSVLCFAERYGEAEAMAKDAVILARQRPEQEVELLSDALFNRGAVQLNLGQLPAAAESYRQTLAILDALYGSDHVTLATPLNNLGSSLRRAGDLGGAREAFERSLAIQRKALGDDHPELTFTLNNLGRLALDQHDAVSAVDFYHQALALLRQHAGADHPKVLFVELNLRAAVLEQAAMAHDAASARLNVLETIAVLDGLEADWSPILGAEHRYVVKIERHRARALMALGKYREAERLLVDHLQVLRRLGFDRDLERASELLNELYRQAGQHDRLEPHLELSERG